jgi:hypothetical protein
LKVLINGRYAYETDLDDVEIGDEMLLPGTMSGPWHGIVTELEPRYDGRCTKVLGLTRRRAKVEAENQAKAEIRITGWRVGDTLTKQCRECDVPRTFRVEAVNTTGRPTSVRADPCPCGAPSTGAGLGSADAFRWFMLEPEH